jgi:hypothetical protein
MRIRPCDLVQFRITFLKFCIISTIGRTSWTGDEPDVRPLPAQDNTTKEDKDIHAVSDIGTDDPSVQAITAYALDRAATGTSASFYFVKYLLMVSQIA